MWQNFLRRQPLIQTLPPRLVSVAQSRLVGKRLGGSEVKAHNYDIVVNQESNSAEKDLKELGPEGNDVSTSGLSVLKACSEDVQGVGFIYVVAQPSSGCAALVRELSRFHSRDCIFLLFHSLRTLPSDFSSHLTNTLQPSSTVSKGQVPSLALRVKVQVGLQ